MVRRYFFLSATLFSISHRTSYFSQNFDNMGSQEPLGGGLYTSIERNAVNQNGVYAAPTQLKRTSIMATYNGATMGGTDKFDQLEQL